MAKLKNAHALLIGVGSTDLPETVTDAKALFHILGNQETGCYYKKNLKLLTSKKATRKGILEAFDELLEKTDEHSSVLLYYSGHGGMYSDNTFIKDKALQKPEGENQKYFHLCPNDYDPNNYQTTWIKAEEIKYKISKLKSRRLIFFLDCCHAAGMTAGVSPNPAHTNADGLAQNIDDGRGMTIISACRSEQLSVILEGDENSLFTKCLMEVLKGNAKHETDDPFVRIFEVVQYIFKKVPERYPAQNPYANLQIFEDFVVSYAENRKIPKVAAIEMLNKNPAMAKKEPVTVFRETENADSAIIFIHGFSGLAENTFSEVPKLLMKEPEMAGWDLFPLGFSGNVIPEMGKSIWACANDIKLNSDYLITSIKNKFLKYNRIAIIAHDLGGIVAQQVLLQLEKSDLARISHLLLFGTPSNGLPEIDLQNFINYGKEQKDLKTESNYINTLRQRWIGAFPKGYPFVFKTVAATRDEYVPITSSLHPFPKKYQEIVEGNHFSMVAIKDADNDGYRLIKNALGNRSFLNVSSNTEEINLLIGKYKAVVNALLPSLKSLDSKGLEQLVFALEGSGREGEAMEILSEHPVAQLNSNLLGIMGGRYKRRYLSAFSAEDLQMAIKYYGMALEMAATKEDFSQIYYHAVNLAFLSLMKGEKGAMVTFAEQSFQAAQKDPFPSLWKWATLGEAYLYKGDFVNAKKNYKKAAKMAGLREKISIQSNAYNAYVSLMQTDNPEDPFIKFLKQYFLS